MTIGLNTSTLESQLLNLTLELPVTVAFLERDLHRIIEVTFFSACLGKKDKGLKSGEEEEMNE